jgi:hypothetical protein
MTSRSSSVKLRNRIIVIIAGSLLLLAGIGFGIWYAYFSPKQVNLEKQRRQTMITYLSNPAFSTADFCEQLTNTKASLQINQLDEHQLYFSIPKKDYNERKTLKKLCIDPKKVEFAKLENNSLLLGQYRYNDTSCLFFRFPDSLLRVPRKIEFKVAYDPFVYTIKDKELSDFINNNSIYGGEYYISRNGSELDLAYGMNHGAFVSVKNEPSLQRFVKKITRDCESDEEKIQALLNFVTNRIKYSFNEAYSGRETMKRPNEVLMSRTSDCSGKTILFASFMEQLGIDYRIAYMKSHVAVFVRGNFPNTNGYTMNVDGKTYYLAETTCPDFKIGESVLDDGTIFSFVQYTQKVGSPSVVTNNTTKRKFEL